MSLQEDAPATLTRFLAALPAGRATPISILCDSDCDGLPAGALLVRALRAAGYTAVQAQPRQKAESAWSPEVLARLAALSPAALFVLDLGSRPDPLLPGIPALLIDHHLPGGVPPDATLLTGYGTEPTPTTGLLVYWAVRDLIPTPLHADLAWLAALSLLSDLGDKAPFPELPAARKRWGQTTLRDLTSLLNAPRRTASGDATAALALLLAADSPKQILSGDLPGFSDHTAALRQAKADVAAALATAKKAAPKFSRKFRDSLGADLVALPMDTPFQVHPLVAQLWRGRFRSSIVMGVNFGFRPGFVHFSARGPAGVNVIAFLREHTPAGADQSYGNGHDQASGGAVPTASWNAFIADLGFGPELQLPTAPVATPAAAAEIA